MPNSKSELPKQENFEKQVSVKEKHSENVKNTLVNYEMLFKRNSEWATKKVSEDPNYFINMAKTQTPKYLWIGCSDSRVPANDITGLQPGDLFVQRNIANLVIPSDLNVQSVIAYAVCHLKVHHILVVGHYGCGGVKHGLEHQDCGFLNAWLTNIQDVIRIYATELSAIKNKEEKFRRVVELNVIESCKNVMKNYFVQTSYQRNHYPIIKGMVYDLSTGFLKDLDFNGSNKIDLFKSIYSVRDK